MGDRKIKILVVIGARPQFIKHAPFDFAARDKINIVTIHTGQHYDSNMSQVFFDQLKIRKPDYILATGGGQHGEQTGRMLQEIEPILLKETPDYVLVYGDTNSTLAGALVASKLNIPVIHVEAGLRSFNKEMPEEINRILTDHVSSLLFTSTERGVQNLATEGIEENVFFTGDIMADAVKLAESVITNVEPRLHEPYYYVTIHRPYNTDEPNRMHLILDVLNQADHRVVFPIHPRTKNLCKSFGIRFDSYTNIQFIEPASYFDNIKYLMDAAHVITDSGGLQKEAYILKTPCITIRSETEWTETLTDAWNVLCFDDLSRIPILLKREVGVHHPTLYGNGQAATQIISLILEHSNLKG
ncbi:non-hydrolyzing UDP-N-acetylglucosamine 2-epimerase [Parapedobacter deserti]|uniref:Non-hydrolyzing UDP-N-acetylglucosamine 2-epimerase n=1 Tax=Parapedobacter deserti TaxID=1912957 RepID=A0ABV7JGK3_9SPHI